MKNRPVGASSSDRKSKAHSRSPKDKNKGKCDKCYAKHTFPNLLNPNLPGIVAIETGIITMVY
jgi:hypothetical protein